MGYVEELRKLVGHRPLILVGSVVIIVDEKDRILLQQRKEPYGKWGLPGGLMELGESPEDTARREVLEETGICVNELKLMNVYSGQQYFVKLANGDEFQTVTVAYYTNVYEGAVSYNKEEAIGMQFFPICELPDYMVGSHRRMIEDYAFVDKKCNNKDVKPYLE
ncbi:MAG: NUDIX hydrolase [Ectobacillus sp.]